ncbi:MAG: hypothetical protein AB1481_06610 [Candidatus Omnitrophota bacterium]
MKKVKTLSKGRKCKFPGCKHILSIYNLEVYCHIHLSQFGSAYKHPVSKER